MSLFDRFLPKKDTPNGDTPNDQAPTETKRRRRSSSISLTDATRKLGDATRAVNQGVPIFVESAKATGEQLKPLGQSVVAGVTTAANEMAGAINTLVSPIITPAAPEPTPEEKPSTTETTAPAAAPVETVAVPVVAEATAAAPLATPSATLASDDALPLPAEFNPFAGAPEPTPSDEATAESRAEAGVPSTSTPIPEATAPGLRAALDAEGNLEEYAEPLPQLAPTPLEAGAQISLESGNGVREIVVVEALAPRGEVNVYRAQDADGAPLTMREAAVGSTAAAQLEREDAARRAIASPQIPTPAAFGTHEQRVYLADAAADDTPTFATQLADNVPLAEQVSTVTQAAAALAALHKAGFVHGALRPEAILLGKPVKLSGFESLLPIGQAPTAPVSFVGYGAPELLAGAPLEARADIYSVGALLHRIVTGVGVAETGWDEATFAPTLLLPGAPQIFAKTLGAPATRYSDMSALHHDMVRLRARLKPLARHESAGETTIGLEWGRTTNQDAWGEVRGQKAGEDGARAWTAWVVSDGMGGMASGEVASQSAVASLLKDAALWGAAFDGKMPPEAEHALLVKTWTREANRVAVEAMNAIGARGGCTLVCGLIIERRLTLAHVGDCRVYLCRAGELTQLTRDHSFVMSLVMQGEITREEIRDHPDRSKITRSLGDRHPMPDYFVDGLEVETKAPSLELQLGDMLLAFSDGVWEPVLEDEMKAILSDSNSLEEAAHRLLEAAMREGGPDNATAYVFQMGETAPMMVKATAA